MRLPDFICVGAQKSGTTWLYDQISRHPQVFMRKKELNYFYKAYDLSWYAKQFENAPASHICGDISPNYSAFVGLVEKIHEICPNTRILHILRNPVERAFSQWKMARFLGNIPREIKFIDAFRSNRQYMKRRGEYASIIKEYARFYPLHERSAVFWYDEIKTKPDDFLRQVMSFLGISPQWQSSHLFEVSWASPEPGFISEQDALEVKAYYEPLDSQLRALLNVQRLPWDT